VRVFIADVTVQYVGEERARIELNRYMQQIARMTNDESIELLGKRTSPPVKSSE
jgi:hypothetical protein